MHQIQTGIRNFALSFSKKSELRNQDSNKLGYGVMPIGQVTRVTPLQIQALHPRIRVCPFKPISWLTFKMVKSEMGEVKLAYNSELIPMFPC